MWFGIFSLLFNLPLDDKRRERGLTSGEVAVYCLGFQTSKLWAEDFILIYSSQIRVFSSFLIAMKNEDSPECLKVSWQPSCLDLFLRRTIYWGLNLTKKLVRVNFMCNSPPAISHQPLSESTLLAKAMQFLLLLLRNRDWWLAYCLIISGV